MDYVLIRHLATENNKSGVIMGGILDSPIIEDDSINQLKERIIIVVKTLENGGITNPQNKMLLITSPLLRCRQTLKIVADHINYDNEKVLTSELFRETSMGDFTNKSAPELRQKYGTMVEEWMYKPESFKFPGGESYKDLKQRVMEGINNINENDCNVALICTHVDVIKMIVSETIGFSFNQRRNFVVSNGSITIINKNSKGELSLKGLYN